MSIDNWICPNSSSFHRSSPQLFSLSVSYQQRPRESLNIDRLSVMFKRIRPVLFTHWMGRECEKYSHVDRLHVHSRRTTCIDTSSLLLPVRITSRESLHWKSAFHVLRLLACELTLLLRRRRFLLYGNEIILDSLWFFVPFFLFPSSVLARLEVDLRLRAAPPRCFCWRLTSTTSLDDAPKAHKNNSNTERREATQNRRRSECSFALHAISNELNRGEFIFHWRRFVLIEYI